MNDYQFIADLRGPEGPRGPRGPGGGAGAEVRGSIPEEITALEQMNTSDYNGIWHLSGGHNLDDAPFESISSALAEVIIGSPATAGKQVMSNSTQSWWREAATGGFQDVSSWGPWRKYVDLDEVEDATSDVLRARGNEFYGIDLNTLRTAADIGHRSVRASNMVGGPDDLGHPGDPLVQIEVYEAAINSVMQRITTSRVSWWRVAETEETWHPWQQYATLDDISGEVLTDRYIDVPPGTDVRIIDPKVYGYNFGAWGEGMTRISDTHVVWRRNNLALLNGQGMRRGSGSGVGTVILQDSADFRDGEVLFRGARVIGPSSGLAASVIARAQPAGSSDFTGYVANVCMTGDMGIAIAIGRQESSGSFPTLAKTPVDIASEQPYWVRFNLNGTALRAKAWADGTPEPNEWALIVEDDAHTNSGHVGFRSLTTNFAVDVLSINERGGRAA